MSLRQLLVTPLLLIALIGCSAGRFHWPGTTGEVEQLLNEQRYGTALSRIQELSQKEPDNQELVKLRHEAIYQAFRYEQQMIAEAQARQDEGDWKGALDTIDEALLRHPDSTALQQTRTELKAEQERRLAELDTDLMLARGNWLLEEKGVLERRRTLAGASWTDGWKLTDIDDELARMQPALILQGERALKAGKLTLAESCFSLAQRIQSDPAARKGLNAIYRTRKKQQSASREREHKAQIRQLRHQFETFLEEAREALARDDLLTARDALAAANAIDSGDPALAQLRANYQPRQEARVEQLITEGNSLYRRGLFHQARDLWREVVTLDPGNTLAQARLDRAERVIEKLERLRSQQLPARQ